MRDFISEDDLDTFEVWLKETQGLDAGKQAPDVLAMWRGHFDEVRAAALATPKVGLMNIRRSHDRNYAVAVREGTDLWLTLRVKRSGKGEFFIFMPRGGSDVHTSYHLDGTFHSKTDGDKSPIILKKQPLTGTFRGTEPLGAYGGHGPKRVGAICDPAVFDGIVEVPPGILGPRDGDVVVDLVEPGHEPLSHPFKQIVRHEVFRDAVPWLVIRVGTKGQ